MFHVSCVTCHVSCVMRHVSPVTCENILSIKKYIFFFNLETNVKFYCPLKKLDKVVELIGGGSVINGASPSSFLLRPLEDLT